MINIFKLSKKEKIVFYLFMEDSDFLGQNN